MFSVFAWRMANRFLERIREIGGVLEAEPLRDFGHAKRRSLQQARRFLHPHRRDVIGKRHACRLPEQLAEVAGVEMHPVRRLRRRKIILAVRLDIMDNLLHGRQLPEIYGLASGCTAASACLLPLGDPAAETGFELFFLDRLNGMSPPRKPRPVPDRLLALERVTVVPRSR